MLPDAGTFTADAFEDVLRSLDGSEDPDIEKEVRLCCFWTRNNERLGKPEGAEPSGPRDDNTARLLELLSSDLNKAILVRGQALRDLGRFKEAEAVYVRMPSDSPWRAQLIEDLHKATGVTSRFLT